HVAAADQVQPREGRVAGQVVLGEDAQVADRLADLVVGVRLGEEAPQPLGRDVQLDVVDVDAGAGAFEGGLADVGGQDFDREVEVAFAEVLEDGDGQRV